MATPSLFPQFMKAQSGGGGGGSVTVGQVISAVGSLAVDATVASQDVVASVDSQDIVVTVATPI